MLTKDLLQFSHRKGRLIPTFVDADKPSLLQVANELRQVFATAPGKTSSEIEDFVKTVKSSESSTQGLKKILLDRCEFLENDEEIFSKRWDIFKIAQEIRDDNSWGDESNYADLVKRNYNADSIDTLRHLLFSDHPDEKKCASYQDISASDLLHEYNRALLQTLFIFCDDVKITFKNCTTVEKRALFRQLKFHSLMSEVAVDPDDASCSIYLSGPLKLFQKSSTYGLRLAKFIPNILHLKAWELEAQVHLKNKHLTLKLDSSIDVKAKGRGLTGYVPEEYQQVASLFNEANPDWKLSPSDDFVHLGKQTYCFPDFDLSHGKKKFHLELFHPWHRGQLLQRIEAASTSKHKNLFIGIDKSLSKDAEISKVIKDSKWFAEFGFEFNQFPTPKQILKVVTN